MDVIIGKIVTMGAYVKKESAMWGMNHALGLASEAVKT